MVVTWLGQGGLLFEKDGFRVMIDPYLSNSVEKMDPKNYRRFPVNNHFLEETPDVIIFTHNHLDHYDPETVDKIITPDTSITVLAPWSVWPEVRKIGGKNNYVLFNRHTSWSQGGMVFTATKAEHSDQWAIGVLIEAAEGTYYITGDTLFNTEIFDDIPTEIDGLFLPVNGVGNNLNLTDAQKFAKIVGAKRTVPIHYGLFDEMLAVDIELTSRHILIPYKQEQW